MRYWFTAIVTLFTMPLLAQETATIDEMIGQMIMTGVRDFYDPDQREVLLQNLEEGKVGGIVLFEKNLMPVDTKAELAEMTLEIQKAASIPVFISIDEEGGRVNRLKPKYGFHDPPSAQELGDMDNLDSTYYYAQKTARTLRDLGMNVNFAPVVDVNINPDNPIIGKIGRSFSADYPEVVRQASVYIRAHQDAGIATVLKHFPGHGSSEDDTHLGIADVSNTWVIEELYPYRMLMDSLNIDAVMTSHVVNRSLDPSKLPGTLSQKIVRGVLRGHLGYEGVVFTDDMQMRAIADHYGLEKAIELAINADVDMLVFANNVPDFDLVTVPQVTAIIKQLLDTGRIRQEEIENSYRRIINLKQKLGLMEDNYSKKLRKRLKSLY